MSLTASVSTPISVAFVPQPLITWSKIAVHAGLSWSERDRDRLHERSRFNSKIDVTQPFVARDLVPGLSDEAKRFVAERIDPLYRALRDQEPAVHELQDRRIDD